MSYLDPTDLARRATRVAQEWAPGCRVGIPEALEGGTVSLVYQAPVETAPVDRVVLKVAPPGLEPVRNRDVLRQARAIDALGRVPGVPVPRVLFADAGDPVEIPPFFATDFLAGECLEPLLYQGSLDAEVIRRRAFAAIDVLVAARALDRTSTGLGREPVVALEEEVDRWTRALDTVPDDLRTGYEACARALHETMPVMLTSTVVHGDFRLGNMLCEGDRINGIIDWELWTLSDPRIDLTWLLFFTDEAEHPAADAGFVSTMPPQPELLAAYEEATGGPVPDLGWFWALTWYKEAAAMALIAKYARRNDPERGRTLYLGMTTELIERAHRAVA